VSTLFEVELTIWSAIPYWKANDKPIERISSATDRLRPDVALGGTVDSLSFPQQDENNEEHAWQKHHETDVVKQTAIVA
jgi:hypothetical protein